MKDLFKELLFEKINTRSLSMTAALLMICSGIYMCIIGLSEKGVIDLKTAFIEGKIETGSLGLMVMFLGIVVILALLIRRHPHQGEEINFIISDNTVSTKNLSYRKVEKILKVLQTCKKNKDGFYESTPEPKKYQKRDDLNIESGKV